MTAETMPLAPTAPSTSRSERPPAGARHVAAAIAFETLSVCLDLWGRVFHQPVASYSATIAADLISEPSTGTNLDIAATDQIRPIATTTAFTIPVRICILVCVALSLAISGSLISPGCLRARLRCGAKEHRVPNDQSVLG
jgi:hypothetical protein